MHAIERIGIHRIRSRSKAHPRTHFPVGGKGDSQINTVIIEINRRAERRGVTQVGMENSPRQRELFALGPQRGSATGDIINLERERIRSVRHPSAAAALRDSSLEINGFIDADISGSRRFLGAE